MMLFPLPPYNWLSPGPPIIILSPFPPRMISLPSKPMITLVPLPPNMRSSPIDPITGRQVCCCIHLARFSKTFVFSSRGGFSVPARGDDITVALDGDGPMLDGDEVMFGGDN